MELMVEALSTSVDVHDSIGECGQSSNESRQVESNQNSERDLKNPFYPAGFDRMLEKLRVTLSVREEPL